MRKTLRTTLSTATIAALLGGVLLPALPAAAEEPPPRAEQPVLGALLGSQSLLPAWVRSAMALLGMTGPAGADARPGITTRAAASAGDTDGGDTEAPPCAGDCSPAGVMGDPNG